MEEKQLYEKALWEIVNKLSTNRMELTIDVGDGRLNSAANEEDVVIAVKKIAEHSEFFAQNNLSIGTPNINSNNNREWYDFSIESTNTDVLNLFAPVNVKITEADKGGADNLSCKLGIFYALTGILPKSVELGNNIGWETFCRKTDEYMGRCKDKDYYFLVLNKNDTSDIFWNSLRKLPSLTENGNNLPFQCVWRDNRLQENRTYEEAQYYILSCLGGSIEKRAEVKDHFEKYLKKYIAQNVANISKEVLG